jgi:thiol-disulfide isomerase/thioredoxin
MNKTHYGLLLLVSLALTSFAFGKADKSSVGQTLPALNLEYLTTAPEYAGKPMIVEFWATWCPPCRQSIPHLNAIYTKYKDKGLVVIGVTKEKKDVVTGFLKVTPMTYFPAIDSTGALGKAFGVTSIPHALLVDKTGKIVWEGHPMSLKDSQIAAILP